MKVKPPASWWKQTRGLLGNFDGEAKNDLELPDGSVLNAPLSWEDFYLR